MVAIRQVNNGWIVTNSEDNSEVFETDSFENNDVEAFARMLRHLAHEIGPGTSRHSEKRIYVEVKPGDKFIGDNYNE